MSAPWNRWKYFQYGAAITGVVAAATVAYLLSSDYADKKHHESAIKKPSSNEADYFVNKKGLYIYTRSIIPKNPKAVIFFIHGLGEHSGRNGYLNLYKRFESLNYAVLSLDHQGHGRSNGTRSHVESYNDFLDDIQQFIEISLAKKDFPKDIPAFIFGHSMGGALTVGTLLRNYIPNLKGAVLSSPALNLHQDKNYSDFIRAIGTQIAYILPKVEVVPHKSAHGRISKNSEACEAYDVDPLNDRIGIRAGLGHELVSLSEDIDRRYHEISIPLLIFHGEKDRVVDVDASHVLYQSKASPGNKTLKLYPEMLHEIWEDEVKEEAIQILTDWVTERL
jgi:alpha-beta hydrolase superfamily lysophospholipase